MLVAKAIKPFLTGNTMPLSVYIAIGILLSQLLNIYSYYSRGGTTLMTWYRLSGVTSKEPSILLISQLCVIMAVITFLACQLFAHYARGWPSAAILPRSILFCIVLCFVSQAVFSSIMRFSYELLICVVYITSLVISSAFLQVAVTGIALRSPEYVELWDLLKFAAPLCIGIPLIMGGAGFITAFYQSEKDMIRLQLYRHIAMAVYFEIGAAAFILYPIAKRLLTIRGT